MKQQKHEFTNGGSRLTGYAHIPSNLEPSKKIPFILMGHGLAAEWQFGTSGYIQAFVDHGYGVFNFDYRHFGESEGTPRQLVDIDKQLSDWQQALNQVRNHPHCDSAKIAIWGSSLGGGLALSTAACTPEIAAVIAQVPHCDASKGIRVEKIGKTLWLIGNIVSDSVSALLRLPAKYVPLLGDATTGYAILDYPGWKSGYQAIVTAGSKWENRIPARSLLSISKFNPIETVSDIKCPTLIVAASDDPGTPADAALETAQKIAFAQYKEYEGDHFDAYTGSPLFDQNIAWQTDFLREVFTT